ncbi:PLP-dependent aminotransferase family protein [Aliikangiella marina]|uniref:PLP-dependent aminotransferase family protein n=1 Tax=Aliikangiella marina TaxID=1712262 RepID=A0A545T2N1_9GAMM|nr:PLP-dependent aminotransferase family protein [Aliikangiella marina]TQV71477.1 PLP-dependent aminotransferase family protein [Aliikangiella marina]
MIKTKKLYQQVADDFRDLIANGDFQPGEKIPSIRSIAKQRKISIATVQRSLEELELRGLIEAKPKSGFYVKMQANPRSAVEATLLPMVPKSVEIHEFASHIFHQCDSPDIVNLGTTYPSLKYFPEKYIQQFASKVIRHNINDVVEVHFSPGQMKLRQVLSKRLNQMGCRVTADDLIITNGCLEGLSLCLRAVAKPGDTIAIESPGFVGLFQLIESLGYKAIEIPCHPVEGMSLEALELALEQWPIKAVALVPTFSNPLGTNMPEKNRMRLVELLADKEVPLIEDDLLGDLSFDGSRTRPCKAFDKKGLVLYCSSASKTVASGLRIGWLAPGAYYKEVSYFKTFTNISAPNITQLTIAEFFKSGKYDRYLRQFTGALAKRMYQFQQAIEKYFPQGTRMSQPQGGCILWVALPKNFSGLAVFEAAIKSGIAIVPGQLSSATSKFDHCIRLNCACDPEIDIDSVIQKLAAIIESTQLQSN